MTCILTNNIFYCFVFLFIHAFMIEFPVKAEPVFVCCAGVWSCDPLARRRQALVFARRGRRNRRASGHEQSCVPAAAELLRGGEHDERRRWDATYTHTHTHVTWHGKTLSLKLLLSFPVRKFAQERIAPFVSKMDEASVMDADVISALFQQGVSVRHRNKHECKSVH